MTLRATYSPDDNRLRLYSPARLDDETYRRVKAAGFKFAPRQNLFFAPGWTPYREDLLIALCGEIGDEDTTLVERAEARAERFGEYGARRAGEAESAREGVAAIAKHIPFGQPILVGHHSEGRARRDAARIDAGIRRAVRLWDVSAYWTERAQAAVAHARYKERTAVRARRIRGLESEHRGHLRDREQAQHFLDEWTKPEELTADRAKAIATFDNRTSYCFPLDRYPREPPASQYEGSMRLWGALDGGIVTPEQARDLAVATCHRVITWCDRWIAHLDHRLAYERAMLAEQGGIASDRTKPEKGGGCRCWASPAHGKGWSFIVKVNRVSVTVLDNHRNGGRNFTRTIPFDKLLEVMSKAGVDTARSEGRLAETPDGIGFYLRDEPEVDSMEGPSATPAASPTASAPAAVGDRSRDDVPPASNDGIGSTIAAGVQPCAPCETLARPAARRAAADDSQLALLDCA